jgi:DNA modification methylase
MENKIYTGKCCLEVMREIESNSIDMILCDLPYGITKNKWDVIIPFEPLWNQYERIIKDNAAIVLFASFPFTGQLFESNKKLFRYSLIWKKSNATGFLNAKKMPLRAHEDILVFYKKLPIYNPQKTTGHKRKVSKAIHKINCIASSNYGSHKLTDYDSTERYPTSVLEFPSDKQKRKGHPTSKPVSLLKNLILTYTNEGGVVLDNCAGSGSTGIAAKETGRSFILIDKYYNIEITL